MKNASYPLCEVEEINNLKEFVEYTALEYCDKAAFEYKISNNTNKKISYRQFKEDIESLGTAFFSLGLSNCNIGILGENSYEWIVTYLATTNGSNVIVPIDKELTPQEMENVIISSGCIAVVYSNTFGATIGKVRNELDHVKYYININPKLDEQNDIPFYELMKKGRQLISEGMHSFVNNKIDNDKMTAIIYTSGTTGVSKGVMLSHRNIMASAIGATQHVELLEKSVLVLPLNHTYGLTAAVISPLSKGKTIFINGSMKKVMGDIKAYKPDHLFLVPVFVENIDKKIWNTCEQNGKASLLRIIIKISNFLLKFGIDLRKKLFKNILDAVGGELRVIVCGGAPLDAKYVKNFRNFGIKILNGYGITECSPIVCVNRNHHYKDNSVGRPLPCCEVKISDPNEYGEGEILVKGKNVMIGYFGNDSLSKEAMEDGWFKTGDIGSIDAEGFVYITGRKKNLIILNNGKNIYPEELEMLILNIPYVKEVLVYSDETNIIAQVYIYNQYISANSIKDTMAELLKDIGEINKTTAYYKNISRVIIRETEFEKTSARKIKRLNNGGMNNV